jgi:hypothetical protein
MGKAKSDQAAEQKPFSELGATGKLAFIGKVLAFVVTFGFAFPSIFGE